MKVTKKKKVIIIKQEYESIEEPKRDFRVYIQTRIKNKIGIRMKARHMHVNIQSRIKNKKSQNESKIYRLLAAMYTKQYMCVIGH